MQVILIGGPTGIGKTTVIDDLLESNSLYTRPISYTTRPRRPNENNNQYIHVTMEEFKALQTQGAFINVDEVYGNFYSMSYRSIAETLDLGKNIIKEVHPQNHAKIKKALPGVISVLLLPIFKENFEKIIINGERSLTADQLSRFNEDKIFYRDIRPQSYPFDIVIYVDTDEPATAIKDALLDKLQSFANRYDARKLDEINKGGYEFIADEFSDDQRITTANFHDLSYSFFEQVLDRRLTNQNNVLEVGAGRGFLLPLLEKHTKSIVAVDLSERMLSYVDSGFMRICASALKLPFGQDTFDFVVSSLADPFLTTNSLEEIIRVLSPNGSFIFSMPSKVWADGLRKDLNSKKYTRFVHSSGLDVEVFSFTYFDDELTITLKTHGFQIEQFQVACGDKLKLFQRPISSAITSSAVNLGQSIDVLPIMQLIVAKKVKEIRNV